MFLLLHWTLFFGVGEDQEVQLEYLKMGMKLFFFRIHEWTTSNYERPCECLLPQMTLIFNIKDKERKEK